MNYRLIICIVLVLSIIALATSTLSKSKKSAKERKKKQKESPRSNVYERGLVVEDVTDEDITNNNAKYCEKQKDTRHFDEGEVLAYVTPWNNHGYEVAKIFGKFTMISPVWLQIKRKPRGMYNVEGTHDIDKGWLKELSEKSRPPKIVPRVLFDGWSESDYAALFNSEDEIERMTKAIIRELQENKMQGAVIEIWSQIGNKNPTEVIHVLTHMSEMFHDEDLLIIIVVPAVFNKDKKFMTTFRQDEFAKLVPLVDFFSLMTYDFSTNSGHAGPSSPLPWIKACVEYLDPEARHRQKILTGLNFYGQMFTSDGTSAIVGKQYLEFLTAYTPDIIWEKAVAEHYSQFGNEETGKGLIFFPSLKSIQARLDLVREMGTGVSIWEIGQGLDYFYDLL